MDPHAESQESPMDPSVGSQQTQLDNLEETEDHRFGDRDETSSDAASLTSYCPHPVSGKAADIVWSAFVTERKVARGRRQCRCKADMRERISEHAQYIGATCLVWMQGQPLQACRCRGCGWRRCQQRSSA
ncbi:unnamed protein product, partial [Phaeothamnion confervicola]